MRWNQAKLRSEGSIHLRDAIASDPNELGKMAILPTTTKQYVINLQ